MTYNNNLSLTQHTLIDVWIDDERKSFLAYYVFVNNLIE